MRQIRDSICCVVGGAGFLGSHLVRHLLDRGNRVFVIDNLCVGKREFLPEDSRVVFLHADITLSESHLRNVFETYKVKYVFNYAAWPYIPDSFSRPLHVFNVNANGAMNVINAAQEAGCEAILQVSSAEIYGDVTQLAVDNQPRQYLINEDEDVRPHSTYGVAKAAVDYFCQTAWRERKTSVISLRQFNCIGERETHPYVVPEIICQVYRCLNNRTNKIYLGNNSTRDFQYAGDAVAMATELLERGQFGEVYNMGSESSIQIYDLAEKIAYMMGLANAEIVVDKMRIRPWEIWHLQSNNSKLYSVIKTRPEVSLEEGLQRTIDWFYKNGMVWGW